MKDIDYVYLRSYYPEVFQMLLDPQDQSHILETLESDSQFLRDLKLMDYSILIGIEEVKPSVSIQEGFLTHMQSFGPTSSSYQFASKCQKFIYHICLIDYLQTYNLKKKMEVVYKSKVKHAKTEEISSMNPRSYQERFYKFVRTQVFKGNERLDKVDKNFYIDEQTKTLIAYFQRNQSIQEAYD